MSDDNSSTSEPAHDCRCELAIDDEPEQSGLVTALAGSWWPAVGDTLRELWACEGDRPAEIGVILTGRNRIHELNRQYREKDRPTDVLTFDLSDSPDRIEGEIYLSVPVAADQAKNAGCSLDEELSRLVVHGFLHLAGYDHHSPHDGRKMAAATRRWLAGIRNAD